jgi:hypothetical protein
MNDNSPVDSPLPDRLHTLSAETVLRRKSSPQKRALQTGILALCAVVAIVLIFHPDVSVASIESSLPSFPETGSAVTGPEPLVAVVANVNFGTITVDGKHLPGMPPLVFSPLPDGDTVSFTASPFATKHCHLGVFRQTHQLMSTGGCSLETGAAEQAPYKGHLIEVTHFLFFSLGNSAGEQDVPSALYTNAELLIQQDFAHVSIALAVPPGQYYASGRDIATGNIESKSAVAPATAIVSSVLANPRLCMGNICQGEWINPYESGSLNLTGKVWSILVPTNVRWQSGTAAGGSRSAPVVGHPLPFALTLRLNAEATAWQLASPGSPALLATLQDETLNAVMCYQGWLEFLNEDQTEVGSGPPMTEQILHDAGVQGCEFRVSSGVTPEEKRASGGVFLWRFGVLLAADSASLAAYPWLPLAPPAEIAAVSHQD